MRTAPYAQMDWQTVLWTIWMVIFTPTFFLIKILYWPVSTLFRVILVLLSPVFATVQFCLRPCVYVWTVLPRLKVCDHALCFPCGPIAKISAIQPLYIYVSLVLALSLVSQSIR